MKIRGIHPGFSIRKCGFVIRSDLPTIGASPDRILQCACHGEIVVEVKSPFTHRKGTIREAMKQDTNFYLKMNQKNEIELKKDHPYFYQVQFQMFVCRVTRCYFVVSTEVDLVFFIIQFDQSFVDALLPQCKLFVLNVVLPELIGTHFTRTACMKRGTAIHVESSCDKENVPPNANLHPVAVCDTENVAPVSEGSYSYCFCNEPNNSSLITCASDFCRVKKYHEECLRKQGKKRFNKNWKCDVCKKVIQKMKRARTS